MTDDLKAAIRDELLNVAPELDPGEVGDDTDLRNDLDLDSMDFLNFMIGLSKRFGVEIPEADYARVDTVAKCADYLASRGRPTA